jgi:hypothetical protein
MTKFSINIYGKPIDAPKFKHISNLFAVSAVDNSIERQTAAKVGGIKDDKGAWNTAGHQDRVINVTLNELQTFAKLYDPPWNARVGSATPCSFTQRR